MKNFIGSLLFVCSISLSASVLNNNGNIGKIFVNSVEELKALVLAKGDHQVYKHEYVPHYRVAGFHLYVKDGALILYNQHDPKTKEYIVTDKPNKKKNDNYYVACLDRELSKFIAQN